MSEPILLYGIGATKAGTSWLYRTLADRADSAFPALKELHYWDTGDQPAAEAQAERFRAQIARHFAARQDAERAGRGWQVANLDRRIADIDAMRRIVTGARGDHAEYRAFLLERAGQARLTGDITPSYALLPVSTLREMLDQSARARMIYLLRDPLERLWSAIRMQAERQLMEGQTVETKANATLWRILHKGRETHLTARGDYAATLERLRDLPENRVSVRVMEETTTQAGYDALVDWLGLPRETLPERAPVHAGPRVEMRDDLREAALTLLKPQYQAACAWLGRVPAHWERHMEQIA